ncbi:hypothetical protein Raf01_63240 [Rugosimonospora africana]|uniref:Uncharacterized protein n=1 Tax=Rugosimonospora africana TaxID=556532 RepID=A0A8J3QXY7_9ACTN|nr:hypothetical protein Raf01_63240 [Rugosimonospora africana]
MRRPGGGGDVLAYVLAERVDLVEHGLLKLDAHAARVRPQHDGQSDEYDGENGEYGRYLEPGCSADQQQECCQWSQAHPDPEDHGQ